ncbi:MAG: glycosyltransferase family 39 protein [Candidatus Aminicenantales bacterium]
MNGKGKRKFPWTPAGVIVLFILIKIFLCLFPFDYGYFRDELYYVALSDNLALGYVDVPPAAPFLLAVVRLLLGTSLMSLHLLPAASGALFVLLCGLMVRKLGGGIFALGLTLTCITLSPQYIGFDSIFTYDTFDKLLWAAVLYLLICLFRSENERLWIPIGLCVGLGLLTKITIVFLVGGLVFGMLLTADRKRLLRPRFWTAAALALLVAGPYLFWQVRNGFPTLEFYSHYASGKTFPVTPLQFILDQVMALNPVAAFVWLIGLGYLLFHKDGKRFRSLGIAYLALLFVFIALKAKFYMLTPFYPPLFAAGAVGFESFFRPEKRRFQFVKPTALAAIAVTGLALVPMARPVLPVETFIKYSSGWTGIKQETHRLAQLPQHYADKFGWPELAAEIASVYRSLPEDERSRAAIFTDNYGEAGAVWLFGRAFGLPLPISGHNQYFLWGPRGASGEVLITFGVDEKDLREVYEEVVEAGRFRHPYVMPYENDRPIFVCRKPKNPSQTLRDFWPQVKNFS